MRHLKPMTKTPAPGQTDLLESLIIFLLTGIFSDWDNFGPVIQNLQKFYRKTP